MWIWHLLLWPLLVKMAHCTQLEVMNEWGVLEFARSSRDYDPTRAVPVSLEVTEDRVFMAIPRLYSGLPASLAVLPRNRPGHAVLTPQLRAWPSERWHRGSNCSETMVNVFRMRLDRCNRLWVLDSGVRDTFETFTVQCQPKILVFDLNTDTLVRTILVSEELLRRNSLLTNLVLDEENTHSRTCDRGLRVYLSDSNSPSVIVYDSHYDKMWRFQHPFMYPDPSHGVYTVEGDSFTLMDGILGLALTPPGVRPKKLFFQPFASDSIFSVETSALERGPNPGDDSELPVSLEGRKSSQAAGMIFDPRDDSLYFSPVSEEAVVSWIPGTHSPRIVAQNRELLQFVLDLRSVSSDSHNIWMISTKMQKFVKQTVNSNVPHIRIIRIVPDSSYHNNTIY